MEVIDFDISRDQDERFVSTFNDPFSMDNVQSVRFFIYPPGTEYNRGQETQFESLIEFRSGQTTGEHRVEAEDFQSLLKKVQQFIEDL